MKMNEDCLFCENKENQIRNGITSLHIFAVDKMLVGITHSGVPESPQDDATETRVGKEGSESNFKPVRTNVFVWPPDIILRHEEL